VVIGAGFSGLTAASQIQILKPDIRVVLLEARDRVGGRSLSWKEQCDPSSKSLERIDLGAAWIWPTENPLLASLASRFEVPLVPEGDGSFRLEGGTQELALKMEEKVKDVRFNSAVQNLSRQESTGKIEVGVLDVLSGDEEILSADAVFVALPPRLVVQDVNFQPKLPPNVVDAMGQTRTWMAQQGKFAARYESRFWRSGKRVQRWYWKRCRQGGPLEILFENGNTIWAFLSNQSRWRSLSPVERKAAALKQLREELGNEEAERPLSTFEQDWSSEKWTCSEADSAEPHPWLHPDYSSVASVFRNSLWDGTLWFIGSETANPGVAGFLEGAVSAASARTKQWAQIQAN